MGYVRPSKRASSTTLTLCAVFWLFVYVGLAARLSNHVRNLPGFVSARVGPTILLSEFWAMVFTACFPRNLLNIFRARKSPPIHH